MPDDRLWKDLDVKQLLEMWSTKSAGQIAAILGRTRSAICGKIGRLRANGQAANGLAKHYMSPPSQARPGSKPRGRNANFAHEENPVTDPTPPQSVEPLVVEPCTIYELDDRRCHWPLGQFTDHATLYCGAATERGIPYCPHHFKRAIARVA